MIVGVCGLGRCGTSMVMQMLDAGGFPVFGKYPSYEESIMHSLPEKGQAWAEAVAGKAVKILDPQRWTPPMRGDYTFIWLDREHDEQAASQLKMAGATGFPVDRSRRAQRGMAALLQRDQRRALNTLERLSPRPIYRFMFEQILADPETFARYLAAIVGPLDIAAAARQVTKRIPDCLVGFLEAELVGRRGLA